MLGLSWVAGIARRRTARFAGAVVGVALAVALLASLGAFFAASRARMTSESATAVPVDWQVQLSPAAVISSAERTVAAGPGVVAVQPVGYATVPHMRSRSGRTVQATAQGQVLGIPHGYAGAFPGEIRFLVGARTGVLIAQQTAANLHAGVGSVVRIGRPGLPALSLKIDGIIDLPAADSMFQAIGAAPGAAPTAPPDNVVVLPLAAWHRAFDAVGRAVAVTTQLHVDLSPALPPDPGAAFAQVVGRAKNLEARLAGRGLVGDNLGARLDGARSDAVYAQLLFLFLGAPGVVLAAVIAAVVGTAGRDRRRREQALLRIRGASATRLVRLAAAEAISIGVLGVAVGLLGAAVTGRLVFHTSGFGATSSQALAWALGAAAVGIALSCACTVLPAWRDARTLSVSASRTTVEAPRRPIWARLHLDVIALAAGGAVYWQAIRNGYQVVLAPEGVPTISVGYFTLLAPLLLWIGSAMLTWRIASWSLARGRRALARAVQPAARGLSGVVAASMSRQRRALSRSLVIMALTAAFAVSTAVFDATYAAQAHVDAQLTNGADVSVTTTAAAGLPPSLPTRVRTLVGVRAAQPMQHRFAYVGNDLQDLYGIDPATIGAATPMSNAFFAGGNAARSLGTLAGRTDGVLVSDETVHDFQLQPGDLLRLRLQSASDNRYHVVAFHYVGIVREFPTAPRDSFLVANASYVAGQTGSAAWQTLLVATSTSPPSVAREIRGALGPASGAVVHDIVTQQRTTLSSLTSIDLSGLTRVELAFAFVLAAGAGGLVLALGMAERRRTFAIASALGAHTGQLATFVWSEAIFVTVGGLAFGVASGWAIAFALVRILTGVFDPPPAHLFVPWAYLALIAAVTIGAIASAGVGAVRATRRPAMQILRDL